MVNLVLDTAVLIDIYRNRREAFSQLEQYSDGTFSITLFTYAEFLAGDTLNRKRQSKKFLQDYPVLDFNTSAKRALMKLSMEAVLSPKHLADFLIASVCQSTGSTLLTPNYKDFTRFPKLKLLKYR